MTQILYIYIYHACSNSHQTDNIEPLTSDTLSQSDLRSSEALWLPARGWQTGSHRWAPAPQPSGCQEDARTSLHLRRLTRRSPLSSGWLSVQPFYLRFASDRLLSHLDVTFVISDQRRYFLLTVNKKKKRGGGGVSYKCQKFPDQTTICLHFLWRNKHTHTLCTERAWCNTRCNIGDSSRYGWCSGTSKAWKKKKKKVNAWTVASS